MTTWHFLLSYTMVIACFSWALSALWILYSTNAILRCFFNLGLTTACVVLFCLHYSYWLARKSLYQWYLPYGREALAQQDSNEPADKAAQAFALMDAFSTFMSFLLGLLVCLRKVRNEEAVAPADGATVPTV